jgi:VWFA-related protein
VPSNPSSDVTRSARVPAALCLVLLVAAGVQGADEKPVPAFRSQADAITVDVVVLDKAGKPVRGLSKRDFTLLEDGKPQAVVGFEARDMKPALSGAPESQGPLAEEPAAEEGGPQRGRTLAFLIDDLGTQVLTMEEVKKTLKRWLDEKADPRDEVTLATTSGDAWWSDNVGRGRGDLEAVLDRIQGKKTREGVKDFMTDWEAYRIAVWEDRTNASAASEGPPPPSGAGAPTVSTTTSANSLGRTLDRVAGRWAGAGICSFDCRQRAVMRAEELYRFFTRRVQAVLRMVQTLSRGLAGSRGRKSIFVFSEGFLNDTQQKGIDETIDASRRANTAVYFIDGKGLAGQYLYGADQQAAPQAGDVGAISMEENFLETAGTESLAENTGGASVRNSNDLLGGLDRVAEESSTYYLLGYQPEKTPDGKWHKLEVKVDRPGVKIRARQGYQATPPSVAESRPAPRPEKKGAGQKDKGPKRPLDPAVMTAGADETIPLHMSSYVMEADKNGLARVLVAFEVAASSLTPSASGRKVALDITVVGVARDQAKTYPLDERAEFDVDPKSAGGWLSLTRDLRMPPGVAQVRVLVRDAATGRAGTATERLVVPPVDRPYLSTPVLTDRIVRAPGSAPRLIPAAKHEFRPEGHLFCMYEVFGMTNPRGQATATVEGGYALRAVSGRPISAAPPTPIDLALEGRVIRMLAIPLDGLAAGDYQLVIDVVDKASGRTLQAEEFFSLRRPAPSPAGR